MGHALPNASTPACAILRDRLRSAILSGDWPPGTHRTLGALALEHSVSISPVREALLSLEGEGLVEIRQHRGAIVPLLDAKLFADLYDLRGALQSLLARRAAERATAAQLQGIATHAAAFAAAAERGDPAEALRHNEAFHAAIDSAADNPQTQAVVVARTAFVNAVRLRPSMFHWPPVSGMAGCMAWRRCCSRIWWMSSSPIAAAPAA